jgi:hypothetical protein
MRIESAVTSVSWIPSEAIRGLARLPFQMGMGHYDDPPPDTLQSLEELHQTGAFRFANDLRAWVDVEDGRVVAHGHEGRSLISRTLMGVGPLHVTFQPTAFPDLRSVPDVSDTEVRFVQTAGGRPGMPAPRTVRGGAVFKLEGPNVWTTLSLTIRADGSSRGELLGASTFPRHWVYDARGQLVAKSGLIDFDEWYHAAFGKHSPWGDEDSPALVTTVETELERQLSATIMRGGSKPTIRQLRPSDLLVEQGAPGDELFLLLDGVLEVEVDGERVGELGPGAVIGERAILEEGTRTATLKAVTACRVAAAKADQIDKPSLARLAAGHRREDR